MTIEISGFLHSLSHAGSWVEVCVQIEAERGAYDQRVRFHGPRITVLAKAAEVAEYKPGMPIVLQIRPGHAALASSAPAQPAQESDNAKAHD